MAHAFSDRALARQEPLITSYVDILTQQLRQHQTENSVDLVPWLTSAAMDVILDLSFGRSLGCLTNTENGKLHPWVELVSGHVKQGLYIQAWRRLPSFLSRNWLVGVVLGRIGRKWMEQFMLTTEMAQQRLAAGADREDFGKIKKKKRKAHPPPGCYWLLRSANQAKCHISFAKTSNNKERPG